MNKVKILPDAYRKDSDSNNYKLFELNRQAIEQLKADIMAVDASLDINQAFGKTLDQYGEMYGQKRGLLNDQQYLYLILAAIAKSIVAGDYESVLSAMILIFGSGNGAVGYQDFDVAETAPGMVKVTKFPLSVLVDAGFSSTQALQIIKTLLPAGVGIQADNFEGTFEFAEGPGEYDEERGFADLQQTIGGYLGLLLGDDDKIPVLPT